MQINDHMNACASGFAMVERLGNLLLFGMSRNA